MFAISDAIINTWQGVSQSLSRYPMPLAAGMAAAHLAAGMNAVNHIRKQQFNSGGGGGGSIGSSAVSAGSAGAGGGGGEDTGGGRMQDIRISLDADDNAMFSGSQVRGLMERMGNELQNGGNFGSFQVVRS